MNTATEWMLLEALRECITEDGARCMTDETRNAASLCRRRLEYISNVAREAIANVYRTDTQAQGTM